MLYKVVLSVKSMGEILQEYDIFYYSIAKVVYI